MKKNAVSILCGVLALILLTACCFLLTSGKITAAAQEACSDKDPALLPAAGTALKPYGVIIAVSAAAALAAGYFLACRKQTRSWRDMSLFSLISIGGGLVLSRLMYVACSFTQNWCNELFWQSAGPLRLWDGGLSMTGVLLAMLLAGLLVPSCRQATGLAAPLFIAGARYAETFTGLDDIYSAMGFGGFSVGDEDLEICPWYAIETDYDFRLNVRFFEILIALLIFIAVLVVPYLLKKRKTCRRSDYRMPLFLVLYGMTQIMMESLRGDKHMVFGFVKVQQITAMILAMIGLFLLIRPLKKYLFYAALCAEVVVPVIALEFMKDRTDTAFIWIYLGMALFLIRFIWAAGYSIHRQYTCEKAGDPRLIPQ